MPKAYANLGDFSVNRQKLWQWLCAADFSASQQCLLQSKVMCTATQFGAARSLLRGALASQLPLAAPRQLCNARRSGWHASVAAPPTQTQKRALPHHAKAAKTGASFSSAWTGFGGTRRGCLSFGHVEGGQGGWNSEPYPPSRAVARVQCQAHSFFQRAGDADGARFAARCAASASTSLNTVSKNRLGNAYVTGS